jgi:hypothetical protein
MRVDEVSEVTVSDRSLRRGGIIIGTAVGVAALVFTGGLVISQMTGDWHEKDDRGVTPLAVLVAAAAAGGATVPFTVPLTTDLGEELDP